MNIRKLWFAVVLGAMPATAAIAQPLAVADVSVSVGDNYDSTAPGVPVESVDVFYDQLAPYGVWVDEPTIGHVFIPSADGFVPYTNGHWQYTNVGFVWVADAEWAVPTTHYGRWAYSQPYARWVWLPDTEWGPSWVEWRQSGDDFGWAPLAPEVAINAGYSPPIASWHYTGAAHVLDAHVTRYYEPRERVEAIHRAAKPMQHYATVSNVRVVVGPPAATLRQYKIEAKPVKVDVRVTGRVASATEAHAQVARAQARKPEIEAQNTKRIQANTHIAAVVAKQPAHAAAPKRVEEPKRVEQAKKPEPMKQAEPIKKPMPERAATKQEPAKPVQPRRVEEPKRVEPAKKPEPSPKAVEPKRVEERKPEPAKPVEAKPAPQHVEERKPVEPAKAAPAKRPEPAKPAEKREPEHH
jgi:hypothetical protein